MIHAVENVLYSLTQIKIKENFDSSKPYVFNHGLRLWPIHDFFFKQKNVYQKEKKALVFSGYLPDIIKNN